MVHTYIVKGMHCSSCIKKVEDTLRTVPGIESAVVTLNPPQATVTMHHHVSTDALNAALKRAGDYTLDEQPSTLAAPTAPAVSTSTPPTTYFPLILVTAYIVGIVLLIQWRNGEWNTHGAMNDFMAAFFIVFSFFKFLDLRGFAGSYASYDVIARRWLTYGYVYPFIELALGIAYVIRFQPLLTNWVTFVVMSVGLIGVVQSLLQKRQIQCACLGTVFNLPMSKVTLAEDTLMAVMALAVILGIH